ncbi:MAG: hypothetical protein IH991_09190, partial [Planctomycetes bacterium]|nr:hypothetical protein [Planctomycetota bacterium]
MKQNRYRLIIGILLSCSLTQFVQSEEPKQLTFDGRLKRDPVFSNGGREIIYSVQHDSPQLILCRLKLMDGTIARVHPKSALPEFRPTLSSNEKAFAFLQMTGNDSLTLKVDLQEPKRTVAIPASKKVVWHASITPDGRQVVYSASGQILSRAVAGGVEKR